MVEPKTNVIKLTIVKKSKIYEDNFAFFSKTNCTRNENCFFHFASMLF